MLMTADAHSLYAKFGFLKMEKPERAMEKRFIARQTLFERLRCNINEYYTYKIQKINTKIKRKKMQIIENKLTFVLQQPIKYLALTLKSSIIFK